MVVAIAAMLAMMVVLAVPAMADVRFDDRTDGIEEQAEVIEDFYDDVLGIDVDEEDIILGHYWGPYGWWF